MLVVENLQTYYGKSHVLNGFSMRLGAGEMVCLLGRNGSGRSTALKSIIGLARPSSGSVRLNGTELAGREPYEISRAGLGYVPEERLVIDNLTVEENLQLGRMQRRGAGSPWTVDEMYHYFPRLRERANTAAGNLSGGEQQMLTICRSLMGNPSVLMIDEPTEGLAPKIVEHLLEVIGDINARGVSILLVEQKMMIALRIVKRCYIVGHGRIVFEGEPGDVRDNPDLRRKWLEAA